MICYDKTEILIKVLGAGQTVGRSCVLVELENRKILFDCGVHLGFKDERKYPNFALILGENTYGGTPNKGMGDIKNKEINISVVNSTISNKELLIKKLKRVNDIIDCVIITHFHMDHIGALPFFTEVLQYKGPVLMSYPTKALSPILLYDGCRLADSRWDKKNFDRQMKLIGENSSDFLKFTTNVIKKDPLNITEDDVHKCMRRVIGLQINETYQLGDMHITPYYAGHVLGACIFKIEVNGFSVIYTGDYNTIPDKHLGSVRIPSENPEILISESTYATYIRPTRKSSELELCNLVHECVNKGGKVLIPVFAIGRAQELSILLDTYWEKMKINFPIYFGGGLTESANQYYSIYSSWTNSYCVSSKIRKNLFDFKHIGPFLYNYLEENRPMVLFATPGMLHTGLALKAFKSWATDPRNLVVLPGYCVQGTVGNKLLMGEKKIQIDANTTIDVLCKVIYLSFSAHADSNGIQQLIKHVYPKQVIFVHGEKVGMEKLAKFIQKENSIPSSCPALGQLCRYQFQKQIVEYAYMHSALYKKLIKKKEKNVEKKKKDLLNNGEDKTSSANLQTENTFSTLANLKVMTHFNAFLFCFPFYRKKKALFMFLPKNIIVDYLKKKHIRAFALHKSKPVEVSELLKQTGKTINLLDKEIKNFKLEKKLKRKRTAEMDISSPQKVVKIEKEENKYIQENAHEKKNLSTQFNSMTNFLNNKKRKRGRRTVLNVQKKEKTERKQAKAEVKSEREVEGKDEDHEEDEREGEMDVEKDTEEAKNVKKEKDVKADEEDGIEGRRENEKDVNKDEQEDNKDSEDGQGSDNEEETPLYISENVTLPFFNLRFKKTINIKYEIFYNFILTFFQQIINTKKKKMLKKFGKQIIIKNIKCKNQYMLYLSFQSLRAVHDGENSLLLQWSYLDDNSTSTVRQFIDAIDVCNN